LSHPLYLVFDRWSGEARGRQADQDIRVDGAMSG